jgi:hypothetical protein
MNPLISQEYPVGDRAAMPGRKGRQALVFYVCGLLSGDIRDSTVSGRPGPSRPATAGIRSN